MRSAFLYTGYLFLGTNTFHVEFLCYAGFLNHVTSRRSRHQKRTYGDHQWLTHIQVKFVQNRGLPDSHMEFSGYFGRFHISQSNWRGKLPQVFCFQMCSLVWSSSQSYISKIVVAIFVFRDCIFLTCTYKYHLFTACFHNYFSILLFQCSGIFLACMLGNFYVYKLNALMCRSI